jgi:hypothetical protein
MLIPGIDQSVGYGAGLAATNAMALEGIKVGDNLLAVVSFAAAGATPVGRDVADFTVGAGTITAGTIDLSNLKFVAIWTTAPDS